MGGSRLRRVVASGTVSVLVAGSVWASEAVPEVVPTASVDCSVLEAESAEAAFALALDCGADVEILAERTEYDTVWATPRSTVVQRVSAAALRTQASGSWEGVDPSVVGDAAGGLSVASGVFDISFTGSVAAGGEFASIRTVDGRGVSMRVPFSLGAPTVDASRVTWPVLDAAGAAIAGADVIAWVHPDTTGVTPVVRVEDLAAYDAVVGASTGGRVALEMTPTAGVELRPSAEGAFEAVDAVSGEPVLSGGNALQWDSSADPVPEAAEVPPVEQSGLEASQSVAGDAAAADDSGSGDVADDRVLAPLPGDRVAPMQVEVDPGSVVAAADEAVVRDPGATWPWVFDPPVSGARHEWTAVKSGWPDSSSSYGFSGDAGVGLCDKDDPYGGAECGLDSIWRLMWEFHDLEEIAPLDGSAIVSATFGAYGTHSYNCDVKQVELFVVGAIGPGTTWHSSSGSWSPKVSSKGTAHKVGACGGQQWVTWDATEAVRAQANGNWPDLTVGLTAPGEPTSMSSWRRYRNDAYLSIETNRAPLAPVKPEVAPAGGVYDGVLYVPSTTPTLTSSVTDPDGGQLLLAFEVWAGALGRIGYQEVTVSSGSVASYQVPSSVGLHHGGVYEAKAFGVDERAMGDRSAGNLFAVDTQAPAPPGVEAVAAGDGALYLPGVETGGVGVRGRFALTPAGSDDVVAYRYGFDDPAMGTTANVPVGGSAQIEFRPTQAGPVTLYVRSVDRAGNLSTSTTQYLFDVAPPIEDAIWLLDEGQGLQAANTVGQGLNPLLLTGAAWGQGPHAMFGSRPGDGALVLNGIGAFAQTTGPVLDTTGSFAVAVRVWLDPEAVGGGLHRTVVGQQGANHSGFFLQYRPACAGYGALGCWSFSMPAADGGSAETRVDSSVQVRGGQWVTLVGEHDAADDVLRLWVCEAGTPTAPTTAAPVPDQTGRSTAPWAATGPLIVGRGWWGAAPVDYWDGRIGDVRVFTGEVVSTAKIRRLCQGAEASDFPDGTGEVALDPTEAGTGQ